MTSVLFCVLSPSPRTPSPTEFSSRRRDRTDEDSLPFHSGPNTPPKPTEFMGTGSLTPRGQLGSRPHTPVGRVDIRPQEDPPMTPQTLCYTPASPKMEFKSAPHTPGTDRWHTINRVRRTRFVDLWCYSTPEKV